MTAGIRNAARRVAIAYLTGSGPPGEAEPESYIGTISEDELSRLSWSEMLSRGLAEQVVSLEGGFADLFVSLAYLRDEAVGEILLGPANSQDVRDWYAKASAEGGHLCNLGNAYVQLGEDRLAIEYYEQSVVIAREIGNQRGEGNLVQGNRE